MFYPHNLCVAPLSIYLYPLANHGYSQTMVTKSCPAEDMSHWNASGQGQMHPSLAFYIKGVNPPIVNCCWPMLGRFVQWVSKVLIIPHPPPTGLPSQHRLLCIDAI
jgi:hypothetical protein